MNRLLVRQLFSVLLVFLFIPLHAEDNTDDAFRYHFAGESLILYLPLPGMSGTGLVKEERNIYPLGLGGCVVYETSLLNRFFSDSPLPGIIAGCSASMYMMEPQPLYAEDFGELAIITLGLYAGYEFLIPLTDELHLLPVITAGARYYVSFHFFLDDLSFAYNPILIAQAGIRLVRNRVFALLLGIEYQVFVEYLPRQTISISLGSGMFF